MIQPKRVLCCLEPKKRRRRDGRSSTTCGCRAARLFDFTTDSWRSRVVVILVFLSVYVHSISIILKYSGIKFPDYDLNTPSDCKHNPNERLSYLKFASAAPHNADWQKNDTTAPATVEEPPWTDDVDNPASAFEEWLQAFSVAIQVIGMIVGLSSRQHIAMTVFSYILYTAFVAVSVVETFTRQIGFIEIYKVATMPGGGQCLYLILPTILEWMVLNALGIGGWVAFSIYLVSCIVKRHDNGNFDDWRLKEFAYPLVRRLAQPIPLHQLRGPDSIFNRILRSLLPRKDIYDAAGADIQQYGINLRRKSVTKWQTIKLAARRAGTNAIVFVVQTMKNAFSTPTPVHARLFQRPQDMIFSTRIILSLSTCVFFMVIIASRIHGIILRLQGPLERYLNKVPDDFVFNFRETTIFQFAQNIVDDLPYISGIACGIGVLIVIVIALLTLQTYRNWIFELRQGRKPFPPVLVGNGTFWASSYLGHQLAHFLLGFFTCLFAVMLGYFFLRILIDFEPVRSFLSSVTLKVATPFAINFFIQFVLARVYTAWGGRDLRFKFTFQVVDLLNTTLSAYVARLTTTFPSFFRLISHFALGLLMAGRLDRPFAFPVLDSAHHTFAGVVYQDHFNNNPIKLVFINELLKLTATNQERRESPTEEKGQRLARKLRLAVLLARYPKLQQLRKHALEQQRQVEIFGDSSSSSAEAYHQSSDDEHPLLSDHA